MRQPPVTRHFMSFQALCTNVFQSTGFQISMVSSDKGVPSQKGNGTRA